MIERDEPTSGWQSSNRDPLPPELLAAVERARARTAAPERVAATTTAILNATKRGDCHANIFFSQRLFQGGTWLVAAAIAGVLLWSLAPPAEQSPPDGSSDRQASSASAEHSNLAGGQRSVTSGITKISLVQVGYGRIETDLDRAEVALEKVSEAVALASVRHDIQAALDDFYDWRTTR